MKFIITAKKKYPYTMQLEDGLKIPIPKQQKFKTKFIREHGCSLVGMYIALRWCGKEWTMGKCLRYAKKHLKCKSKYPIVEIARALKSICGADVAKFKRTTTAEKLTGWLKRGWLIVFEERDPIHTVVLVWDGKNIKRISSGKVTTVTAGKEIKKMCKNKTYRGLIVIKKTNK